jgi:hypothetical protein
MSQTSAPGPPLRHPEKLVYFATGSPAEVAADFRRLQLAGNGTGLRVVAPSRTAEALRQQGLFRREELVSYWPLSAPFLWLRLLAFLGFSRRTVVVCLSARQRFRFLKFLALTLRGRVLFSPTGGERVPLSPLDLAGIWLRQRLDAREESRRDFPIGVVGSASGYYLGKIVPVLRRHYPGAPLHGLLLPQGAACVAHLFDSVQLVRPGWVGSSCQWLQLLRSRKAYQRWVVPCTNEPYRSLKLLAFVWPLSRRQIYNELGDGFPVRKLSTLWGHLRWRLRDRLIYQIVAGAAGNNAVLRAAHLLFYGVRVLSAVPVLAVARLRALCQRRPARSAETIMPSATGGWSSYEGLERRRLGLARRNPVASGPAGEARGTGGTG